MRNLVNQNPTQMPLYIDVDDHFISEYHDKFNLLLVTATVKEKEAVHQQLKPLPGQSQLIKIQRSKHTYYVGIFGAFYAVHVACNEMGSVGRGSSLVTVIDAITAWNPTVVLMVGIAFGANKKKQKIGDVLVSELIIPYDPKRVGKEQVIARGNPGAASSILIDRYKSATDWGFKQDDRTPEIIPGKILSGETLLDNPELKKELLDQYKEVIGGEMEGAGLYAACDGRVNHWILVKGICDFADGNKGKKKNEYQNAAIASAVSLSEHVFNAQHAFKDVSLTVQDEVLKIDFAEEKGGIPDWMRKKERQLAKEVRDEDK